MTNHPSDLVIQDVSKPEHRGTNFIAAYRGCRHGIGYKIIGGTPILWKPQIMTDEMDKVLSNRFFECVAGISDEPWRLVDKDTLPADFITSIHKQLAELD